MPVGECPACSEPFRYDAPDYNNYGFICHNCRRVLLVKLTEDNVPYLILSSLTLKAEIS